MCAPKLILSCPDVDADDPVQTLVLYQQFQSSVFDSTALESQAAQELNARLIELYGTDDYATVVSIWQSNPASVPVGGEWGIAHAATTLLQVEIQRGLGASNADLADFGSEQVARWYAREAIARCNDGTAYWMNPLNWTEDSRLDYYTPRLFVEWYLSQL